jgi:regulation of enolase protein 1 (concanavalin A-like superfamily)
MPTSLAVAGIPFDLTPSAGADWVVAHDRVHVVAPARSDLFIDPSGQSGTTAETMLNAVTLLGAPGAGDFVFSARVSAGFRATFDAAVLLVWADERHWAKLCFEQSPAGAPMVVSVVTRGVSDDANSFTVDGDAVWLRVSRIGRMFALHASTDGDWWHFVRAFALGDGIGEVQLGFEGQSPTGQGCAVSFERISFARQTLGDLRDGR